VLSLSAEPAHEWSLGLALLTPHMFLCATLLVILNRCAGDGPRRGGRGSGAEQEQLGSLQLPRPRVRESFCVRQDGEPWLYSLEYGATSARMRSL
jgi:hypothetical protein